jgi:4-amino-4-deoxy-L-arabinose transferase-like glycosyltransferase
MSMDHLHTPSTEREEPSLNAFSTGNIPGPRTTSFSPRLSWLILLAIGLLYVGTCFTPVIFDDNEGLYAGAVREMHARGDWLVPMSNGFPRVQKPPLVYWTMLLSTSLFGENEFALRLPNAMATVGWIVATWLIARRLGGERFGIAAALVLASMLGVWVFTHLVQPEPFLSCFISLALWCLVEARTSAASPENAGRWYFRFWVFLALGTISKGLHGALWPLGTTAIAALACPSWRPWLRPIFSLRGLMAFLLLVAPWYIYMAVRFPGFLHFHFLNEQLGASLNNRYPPDAKQLPVWQFYLQHLLFWLPWTLLLPAAILAALRAKENWSLKSLSSPGRDVASLLLCWVGLVMVSVAISARQDYYSMSCWGAVAAFLALPWLGGQDGFPRLSRWYLVVPCLLIAAAGLFSLGFAAWMTPQLSALGNATAAPIRSRDTFMDAITGISPALWGKLIFLLAIFGAATLIAGAMAGVLTWRRRYFPALLVLAGANAVPVILAAAGFTIMSPYFSLAENARAINQEIAVEPRAVVACEALPNTASSLLCYLNARVHWVNAPFDNQYAQQVLGQGRSYYWDDATLETAWRSSAPVYLIVDEDRLPRWQDLLLPAPRIVHRSGTRMVLANR